MKHYEIDLFLEKIQSDLLNTEKLTFELACSIALTMESTSKEIQSMNPLQCAGSVNVMKGRAWHHPHGYQVDRRKSRSPTKQSAEYRNDYSPWRARNRSSFFGKCFNCGSTQHYVRDCRAPKNNTAKQYGRQINSNTIDSDNECVNLMQNLKMSYDGEHESDDDIYQYEA